MTTQHPRIQVTLKEEINDYIAYLAEKENCSKSAISAQLIEEALELHEDLFLAKLSDKRLKESKGKNISHDDAWQ